jgi:hypothetical protein
MGGRLKRQAALYVAVLIVSLARFAPAAGQSMQLFYPGFGVLPPQQIVAIVRSAGLDPLSRPARQGSVYVVRANNRAGQEVRVIVDAQMGRIVKVVPLATAGPSSPGPPRQAGPGGDDPTVAPAKTESQAAQTRSQPKTASASEVVSVPAVSVFPPVDASAHAPSSGTPVTPASSLLEFEE